MTKPPRPTRRHPDAPRRRPDKPPAVVTQNVLQKTESAREAAGSRPRVLYGAAVEKERYVARLPITPEDVQRHRLMLVRDFGIALVAVAFAIWVVVSASLAQTEDPSPLALAVPSIISGIGMFIGMYALVAGIRRLREGPRAQRVAKRKR